jgi:hypothetical protein
MINFAKTVPKIQVMINNHFNNKEGAVGHVYQGFSG